MFQTLLSKTKMIHKTEKELLLHRLQFVNSSNGNEGSSKVDPIFMQIIPCGIAFHHAGLNGEEREVLFYVANTCCF